MSSDVDGKKRGSNIEFVTIGLIFVITISMMFMHYRDDLHESFDYLLKRNLTAYAESQKCEIEYYISDVNNMLSAINLFLQSSAIDPAGEWMSGYMASLNKTHAWYNISYITISALEAGLTPDSPQSDIEVMNQLINNQASVSELRYSERLGGSYFAIAVPVRRDEVVIGAIRCLISADILLSTMQTGYLRDHITPYVVDSNGKFVYLADKELIGYSFIDMLRAMNVEESDLQEAWECFELEQPAACKLKVPGSDDKYFIAVNLGLRDWTMLYISYGDEASSYISQIMNSTLHIGISLVIFTAILAIALFVLVLRQRHRERIEHERLSTIARFSDVVLFEYRLKTGVLTFTDNVRELIPLNSSRISGDEIRKIGIIHPDDIDALLERIKTCPDYDYASMFEFRVMGNGGRYFWCECQTRKISADDDVVVGRLINIDMHKKREIELAKNSMIDSLTGMRNKKAAENEIDISICKLREKASPGVLIMIDIDDFKHINDSYGHAAGDAVLAEAAYIIRSSFRDEDIVGRIGGDEFVVFVCDINLNGGIVIARRLISAFNELNDNGPEIRISLSVGIAETPLHGSTYVELFASADEAMYNAKRAGKNQIAIADDRA